MKHFKPTSALSLILAAVCLSACNNTPVPPVTDEITDAATIAPVTTEAPITTEAPVTTEAPITTDAPITTEAPTEPITEPVTEPITEPVTEPITEPVTEPITEPVTEPITTAPEEIDEPFTFEYPVLTKGQSLEENKELSDKLIKATENAGISTDGTEYFKRYVTWDTYRFLNTQSSMRKKEKS